MIPMRITKMHGLGNSQILVEDLEENLKDELDLDYSEIARALCDSNFGVGSDQTLIILPSDEADFRMRVFNRDGSEAEMCGNGIRCVSQYLFDEGKVDNTHSIETLGGTKDLRIIFKQGETSIEVDMGEGEILEEGKKVNGFEGFFISVGNPHFVVFTDKASKELAMAEGSSLENASEFQPDRTNVEFANPVSREELETYVWERGAGLTLACGTGACATAFVARERGLVEGEVRVNLLGGTLIVVVDDDGRIKMRGPVQYVLEGEVFDVSKIYSNLI